MRLSLAGALAGAVLTGSLCGCATPAADDDTGLTAFSRPQLGAVSTVSVGDALVSQGTSADQEGLELHAPVRFGKTYTLGPGFYPKLRGDEGASDYEFGTQASSPSGLGGLTRLGKAPAIKRLRTDRDGANLCVITASATPICNPAAKAELTRRPVQSNKTFRQALIYNGRAGDNLFLVYQEFYGSSPLPTASNTLQFDAPRSDILSFRGASIKVIKVEGSRITYELLSYFDPGK